MEKREAGAEVQEEVVMQQYPSPTADGHDDGPFYNTGQRDHQIDMQDPSEPQPPTPHQQTQRPSVSAEELQLAAQLTRDLATGGLGSMMGTSSNGEEQVGLEHQDPSLQTLQSLQNHDPNLQSVMPHQEAPQAHHYVENPPPPPHLPPHVQMSMPQAHQYAIDAIPPRKRSKVSRACDECRRKKVKCDAGTENGEEPCSNCRRSAIRCLFSRVPQKRGPSKGYIKELADRINSIEGKLGSQTAEALDLSGIRRESADAYSPSLQLDESSRKRPYSSISADGFDTPPSNRHAGWASEPRPGQPYQTSDQYRTPHSAGALAPKPSGPKTDTSTPARPVARVDGLPEVSMEPGREIDEGVFQGYVSIVHHVFPVLPSTRARAQADLLQCPLPLREAFIEALNTAVHPFAVPGPPGDARTANRLLADWEADSSEPSSLHDLVYLQTLLLMIIGIDSQSPTSGERGGPSKATLLGRAAGLAYSMSLHLARGEEPEVDGGETDPDSEYLLRIRVWWALVLLDRFNAFSTGSPLLIPNDSVVVDSGLRALLGEASYRFIWLGYILGLFQTGVNASLETLGVLGVAFNGNMELWRGNLPADITPTTSPIVHLTYWHCRMLAYLFHPGAFSTDVLWAAQGTVGLLLEQTSLLSPLNHHFTCLTALCLLQLTKLEKTREEANKLLKEIVDSNIAPSPWDHAIRDKIAAAVRPSTGSGVEATASQSLQHLADLATATETAGPSADAAAAADATADDSLASTLRTSRSYEKLGFDPRDMLRRGYLTTLSLSSS